MYCFSPEVCFLRFDFETFDLRGPVSTAEDTAANIACQDSFVVKVCKIHQIMQFFNTK
jgi:hypothetical protein